MSRFKLVAQACVYQVTVWHKNLPELPDIAVIVKTNLKTGPCVKVLLFSDGLALASEILIAYYPLRFQIGFTTGIASNSGGWRIS